MTELFYRYDFYNIVRVTLELNTFEVLRHTPKGTWLDMGYENKKWVLRDARKRFAHPTKEEALVGFLARKRRQLKILKTQVTNVEAAIRLGENFDEQQPEGQTRRAGMVEFSETLFPVSTTRPAVQRDTGQSRRDR